MRVKSPRMKTFLALQGQSHRSLLQPHLSHTMRSDTLSHSKQILTEATAIPHLGVRGLRTVTKLRPWVFFFSLGMGVISQGPSV